MFPIILLSIGVGGYFLYKRQAAGVGYTASPYHTDVLNLPPAHSQPIIDAGSPLHGGQPLVPGYVPPPSNAPSSGNPLNTGLQGTTFVQPAFQRGNILSPTLIQDPLVPSIDYNYYKNLSQ